MTSIKKEPAAEGNLHAHILPPKRSKPPRRSGARGMCPVLTWRKKIPYQERLLVANWAQMEKQNLAAISKHF